MRIAEEKQSGPGRDGLLERIEIDLVGVPLLDQWGVVENPGVAVSG